jgi:hypothetical protein
MARQGIVEWNAGKVLKQTEKSVEKELFPAAQIIESAIKRKFRERTFGTGAGELLNAIGIRKSRFKGGGYIIGVFAQPTAKWEDSVGARAIFFEFGRAAPGQARSKVKAQPPRSFIRSGLRSAKSAIRRRLKLSTR